MSKNLIRHLLGEDAIPDFKDAFPLKRQKKRKKKTRWGRKKNPKEFKRSSKHLCSQFSPSLLMRVCSVPGEVVRA